MAAELASDWRMTMVRRCQMLGTTPGALTGLDGAHLGMRVRSSEGLSMQWGLDVSCTSIPSAWI